MTWITGNIRSIALNLIWWFDFRAMSRQFSCPCSNPILELTLELAIIRFISLYIAVYIYNYNFEYIRVHTQIYIYTHIVYIYAHIVYIYIYTHTLIFLCWSLVQFYLQKAVSPLPLKHRAEVWLSELWSLGHGWLFSAFLRWSILHPLTTLPFCFELYTAGLLWP